MGAWNTAISTPASPTILPRSIFAKTATVRLPQKIVTRLIASGKNTTQRPFAVDTTCASGATRPTIPIVKSRTIVRKGSFDVSREGVRHAGEISSSPHTRPEKKALWNDRFLKTFLALYV